MAIKGDESAALVGNVWGKLVPNNIGNWQNTVWILPVSIRSFQVLSKGWVCLLLPSLDCLNWVHQHNGL